MTCSPSFFPAENTLYFRNNVAATWVFDQQAANWAAVGIMGLDVASDYDVKIYDTCTGLNLRGSSQSFAGRTDFVIGDFNENPTGARAADLYCYGGACAGAGAFGAGTWRNGDLMFVDFPAKAASFDVSTFPVSPDAVLHVWDVFLTAGSTYYFEFSSTLGAGSKMLLFRNPGGGEFWTGRGGAEFEVSSCHSYTAPATGYYGLVVVNDVWQSGSYRVAVSSTLTCGCSDELPAGTPVAVPATPATAYKFAVQNTGFWNAVGVRPAAGDDWDLEVGTGGPVPGCAASALANSVAGGSVTDFVASDFTNVLPEPLAIHAFRYAGAGGARIEWARSGMTLDEMLIPNGRSFVRSWGADDVLECWTLVMYSGVEYTFDFNASPNMKLFLFQNPGPGLYASGRAGAILQTSSSTTFTAPETGGYGVVVVKDDDQPGVFSLRVGNCTPVTDVPDGFTFGTTVLTQWPLAISPTHGRWAALAASSMTADWDLILYGPGSAPWPDCFSPVRVGSVMSSVPDFIVGDFHHNPIGTYHFRAFQFTSGAAARAAVANPGPARVIAINAPSVPVPMSASEPLHLHEAYLVAGLTYQIDYTQTTSRPLLVFGNASGGEYWAGRGAALLSTLGSTTFTPGTSGYYAFVVANDQEEYGDYSLGISTATLVGTDAPGAPRVTRFEGAFPNPGRGDLDLRYSLAAPAHVRLELVDLSGRRLWSDDQGSRSAGRWNATLRRSGAARQAFAAGIYFLRFEVDGRLAGTQRLTLLE